MIDFMVENVEVQVNGCIDVPKKFIEKTMERVISLAKRKGIPMKRITFFASGDEAGIVHLFGVSLDDFDGFMYVTVQVVGKSDRKHVSVQFLEVKEESIEPVLFS